MKTWIEPYLLRFNQSLMTAAGTFTHREGFILLVEDEAGNVGRGDAAPLPGFSKERPAEVRLALERWVPDQPFAGPPSAAHAVEQALLHLQARAADTSMAAILSEGHADHVPVNRLVRDPSEAAQAVMEGFGTVKFKVGHRVPVSREIEAVMAIRDAIGSAVALRLDANASWTLAQAREVLLALRDCNIEYVEEPVRDSDLPSMASLRDLAPIAADESVRTAGDLEQVIDAGAADVVVIKPMLVGGPRTARRLIRRSVKAGLPAVVTTSLESVVGRTAALHLAASVPGLPAAGLDTGRLLADDLGPDLSIVRGEAWL